MNRTKGAWTKAQDKALVEMLEQNIKIDEIARSIGRSKQACQSRLSRYLRNNKQNTGLLDTDPLVRAAVTYLQQLGDIVFEQNGYFLVNYRFKLTADELIKKARRVKENYRRLAA